VFFSLQRPRFEWFKLLFVLSALSAMVSAQDQPSRAARESSDAHMLEELGVNTFTTPNIALVFRALDDLAPLPFDTVWRGVPESLPHDRATMALVAGATIADGFLAVGSQKQSRMEPLTRHLRKLAQGLGVGGALDRNAQSLLERVAAQDWTGLRLELSRAQRDVEKAMMALRDEEIAHLIALGGWLRAVEIASTIVAENQTPERAALLVQPTLVNYFHDRVSTLNPKLKALPEFMELANGLAEIRALVSRTEIAALPKEDVVKLRTIAQRLCERVLRAPSRAP
jgi:hypothetical protein